MKTLFDKISNETSSLVTRRYSTSFSIAVRLLAPSIRQAIYNIYGFVRVADEIVDSFDGYPKEELFNKFENEYKYAKRKGISTNLIINAFQKTVKQYSIEEELVDSFLSSMRADLTKQVYSTQKEMEEYIYGSADVVGLMCLKVFVKGDEIEYDRLKGSAMKLGTAFQKVNFLRDYKQDFDGLSRSYFPNTTLGGITPEEKGKIIAEIKQDFKDAYVGLKQLPKESRLGVYIAYKYYSKLLKKIEKTPAKTLKQRRVRVPNYIKTFVLFKSYVRHSFNIL